jgi:integrase
MKGCRPLTDSEIENVMTMFETTRDKTLFQFMLNTGFRITEALSIQVKDIMRLGKIVDRVTVERKHMKKKQDGIT